jgi:hypothetical protein
MIPLDTVDDRRELYRRIRLVRQGKRAKEGRGLVPDLTPGELDALGLVSVVCRTRGRPPGTGTMRRPCHSVRQ